MGSYPFPDSNDQAVWKLDESAAPFANSGVGGSASLTLVGTPTVNQPGKYGKCVQFPGSGANYLTSPNGVIEPPYPLTLSCWVYLVGYTAYGSILVKNFSLSGWVDPWASLLLRLSGTGDGRWGFGRTIGGVWDSNYVDGALPLGVWCHIGVAYDGTNWAAYQNGNPVLRVVAPGAISYGAHGPWYVGGCAAVGGSPLNGYIDDIRIANVARSEAWFRNAYEGVLQREAIVIKSGIPTIIGTDTLRADRGAHAGLTTTGLASGDAVQVSGALTLGKASIASVSPIIGIYDGVSGSVVREGVVVATFSGSCPAAGSAVYLSATAGQLTGTKPTSDKLHEVGVVVDASTSKILLQPKPVIVLPDA